MNWLYLKKNLLLGGEKEKEIFLTIIIKKCNILLF